MTLCLCGHPHHHHHGGCRTETITGPASSADAHKGRTITACQCSGYQATQETK